MKVKIFESCNSDTLEKEINDWLNWQNCIIKYIKQSQSGDGEYVYYTISIWYEINNKNYEKVGEKQIK